MKRTNLAKVLTVLLCAVMLAVTFGGCTGGGKLDENQSLVYNLGAQPESIDPAINTAVDGANVITACFEGLTRLDENGNVKPGVASEWTISDDGLTYTFKIRKDAKWSDGEKVTAKDFAYAWERALDPETKAEYCYQMFYIKGAEEHYLALADKKTSSFESVGVKVKDDYTFEVTLKAPTPYFLELCAFPTLMPVRKDIVEKDPEGWALEPETYIGNGPFKLTAYTQKDSMEFEKNMKYWDAKNVTLSKMTFTMIVESSSAVGSFNKGDLDLIESPPAADIPSLKSKGEYRTVPYIGTYFVCFNNKRAPFDNPKVREAFTLAISRQPIIDAILKAGQKPATAFVPFGIGENATEEFRTKGGDYFKHEGDIERAKELLAEAGFPGGAGFPEIVYLYNTNENHKRIGEALQDMWSKNLGVKVTIQNQDWAVFQETRKQGEYDIARHGWIGDYMDPMTFLDMWLTGGGNNDAKFENAEYDKLIKDAQKETDPAKRMKMLHEAEDIFMKEFAVCPIYFYVSQVCEKPYVKGLYKTATGNLYFEHVKIDVEKKNAK